MPIAKGDSEAARAIAAKGAGRPKLTKDRIALPMLFEKYGYDWAEQLAELLKAENFKTAKEFIPFLPYLCFQIHANPIELKPDSPESSLNNVLDEVARKKQEAMNGVSPTIS